MKERDPVLAGVFPHSVAKSVTRGHDGVKAASQCATRHVYQEVNECYAKFDVITGPGASADLRESVAPCLTYIL